MTSRQWVIAASITVLTVVILTWDYIKPFFMGDTWDYWTNKRINDLHPHIRERASAFINAVQDRLGIKLRLTDGYRTWEEQAELYAKGRSAPGNIVTDARAGESYHNYGLALDVVPMLDGQPQYGTAKWNKIAQIGKEYGFKWGGDFNSISDKPHFYDPAGYDVDQLAQRHELEQKDSQGYVKLT